MAGELTRTHLRGIVEGLALAGERWSALVRHDPSQRVFERVIEAGEYEAWLICWMPGHDTGFHDHDVSSGAVTVVSGQVLEERMHIGGSVSAAVYGAGQTFSFSSSDIHRVTHTGDEPAVTLHAYSPRLRRMGAYSVAGDGILQRFPLAYGEELRPREAA